MTMPVLPFPSVPDPAPLQGAGSPGVTPEPATPRELSFERALASAMHTPAPRAPERNRTGEAPPGVDPPPVRRALSHGRDRAAESRRDQATAPIPAAPDEYTAPAGTAAPRAKGDDRTDDADAADNGTSPAASTRATIASLALSLPELGTPVNADDASGASAPDAAGSGVHRDLALLRPDVRARLERIIGRMHDEYGYTVEVVETTRSQERQDALFRQGRTAPGPVVTWTRNSQHTQGLAADLAINGAPGDAVAYQRLARIVAEEGMRTLGARDPGHVELATTGAVGFDGTAVSPDPEGPAPIRAAAADGMARVASVAKVAAVALPAAVARVAAVAVPGAVSAGKAPKSERPRDGGARPATPSVRALPLGLPGAEDVAPAPALPAPAMLATRQAPEGATDGRAATATSSADEGAANSTRDRSREDGSEPAASQNNSEAFPGPLDDGRRDGGSPAPRGESASVGAASSTEHIARLFEMRDTAAERPLSSVLLRLEHADGGEERVRVDLRGHTVGATFDVRDSAAAEQLTQHMSELTRALGRQGLEADAMTIRTARAQQPALSAAVTGAAGRDTTRAAATGATGGGEFANREDRGQSRQDTPRQGESPRQRPRRDARGDR